MSDLKTCNTIADTIIAGFQELCAMKQHPKLEFIGEQETLNGEPLYLYNCLYCGATVCGERPEDYNCK